MIEVESLGGGEWLVVPPGEWGYYVFLGDGTTFRYRIVDDGYGMHIHVLSGQLTPDDLARMKSGLEAAPAPALRLVT